MPILGQSQAIKNSDTQTANAVLLLRAKRRLALSGTPMRTTSVSSTPCSASSTHLDRLPRRVRPSPLPIQRQHRPLHTLREEVPSLFLPETGDIDANVRNDDDRWSVRLDEERLLATCRNPDALTDATELEADPGLRPDYARAWAGTAAGAGLASTSSARRLAAARPSTDSF